MTKTTTDRHAKIYVSGHRGMVGRALVRCLQHKGYTNILARSRAKLDLLESGSYLDEDDTVCFEDSYGRKQFK